MEKDRYTLYDGDKPLMRINKRLVDQQDCEKNVEAILAKHAERLELHVAMLETDDAGLLQIYDKMYTEVEFELQDLWKFPRDANFHRFWERPKCGCPKMDNAEWYPVRQVISGGCAIHGSHLR